MDGVDIKELASYRKDSLKRLANVDVEAGAFVGVAHCAKWIPSVKCPGKERVVLNIVEVFLLADPVDDRDFSE
jgi:hypothetical protein